MKIKIIFISLISLMSLNLKAQSHLIPNAEALNNNELWTALTTIDVNGNTAFGKCKVQDATACTSCACDYYFTANIVGSVGKYGWPKNPASGDSTGCMNGCWGGYTPDMCTTDIKANARAMLLRSLTDNACGTPINVTQKYSLHISSSADYKFVNPQLNGGEVLCGTTKLAPEIAGVPQFTELSAKTCRSAYLFALKNEANGGGAISYMTKSEFYGLVNTTNTLQDNIVKAGQLNIAYDLLTLNKIQPLIDGVTPTKPEEVALLWTSLGSNITKLPSNSFSSINLIYQDLTIGQREAAVAEVNVIDNSVVASKNYTTLDEAIIELSSPILTAK